MKITDNKCNECQAAPGTRCHYTANSKTWGRYTVNGKSIYAHLPRWIALGDLTELEE